MKIINSPFSKFLSFSLVLFFWSNLAISQGYTQVCVTPGDPPPTIDGCTNVIPDPNAFIEGVDECYCCDADLDGQCDTGNPNAGIPVDGGVWVLLIAGAAFGIRKLLQQV